MRLLLVEDDPELSQVLEAGFREHHLSVTRAASFAEARTRAMIGTYDAIVLDVMLPGGSGFELARALRQRNIATPILMLTARDAVDDRVKGLEAGADDYLTKPFEFRELLARVRALLRRAPVLAPQVVTVADLEVDLRSHKVKRAGQDIVLTAKEFALLECFLAHKGEVVDRAMIVSHVWDENHDPFTNVIEVLVRRLRRKIDEGHDVKLIQTLRGSGYRFGA